MVGYMILHTTKTQKKRKSKALKKVEDDCLQTSIQASRKITNVANSQLKLPQEGQHNTKRTLSGPADNDVPMEQMMTTSLKKKKKRTLYILPETFTPMFPLDN